jgi:hypothetical protein
MTASASPPRTIRATIKAFRKGGLNERETTAETKDEVCSEKKRQGTRRCNHG